MIGEASSRVEVVSSISASGNRRFVVVSVSSRCTILVEILNCKWLFCSKTTSPPIEEHNNSRASFDFVNELQRESQHLSDFIIFPVPCLEVSYMSIKIRHNQSGRRYQKIIIKSDTPGITPWFWNI